MNINDVFCRKPDRSSVMADDAAGHSSRLRYWTKVRMWFSSDTILMRNTAMFLWTGTDFTKGILIFTLRGINGKSGESCTTQ